MDKKVVVFCSGRCGSTLLCRTLSEHPQIKNTNCDEPFCHWTMGFQCYHNFINQKLGLNLVNKGKCSLQEVCTLMDNRYLDHVFSQQDIVKVLYYQMTTNGFLKINPFIFNYILKQKNILVIHLSRINLLHCFLSLNHTAVQTNNCGKWLTITHNNIRNHIKQWLTFERIIDSIFYKNSIKIYYEDLTTNFDEYIYQIEDKLGIEKIRLKQACEKMSYTKPIVSDDIMTKLQEEFTEYIVF
jgi:hypothetical protein